VNDFEGEVALVTGGGSGLGAAISRELGGRGAAVMVTDVDPDSARSVADQILATGGTARSIALDTPVVDQHWAAVDATVGQFGALTLAVRDQGQLRGARLHQDPAAGNVPAEAFPALAAQHPVGHLGEPEEVSALVCFLLSSRASFITGSYPLVDGGFTAQ
jgi:NAD(P)-dependent dehydrogenase (short-subunit alcohol dehydrogenase family)